MNYLEKLIPVYDKHVKGDSVRILRSRDIVEIRCVYAEWSSGLPLDDNDLLELDEVLKDDLHAAWLEANECDPGIDIIHL